MNRLTYVTVGVLILGLLSCGKHKARGGEEIGPDGRPIFTGPRIEVVWVDPTILESDLNMTLMRSDSIDSVEVSPDEISTPTAPAISFQIADQSCWTSVTMFDSRGQVLLSLLHKQLGPGFYKLTVHKPPPAANPGVPYNYSLQARYCNHVRTVQIGSGRAAVR